MSDKSYVTLECKVCPVCGVKFQSGAILMDTRIVDGKLRETFEHETVTGWDLCPDHKKAADDDFIAIVEIDPAKSKNPKADSSDPGDVWRTGRIAHIKRHAFKQLFNVVLADSQSVSFCEQGVMDYLLKLSQGASSNEKPA